MNDFCGVSIDTCVVICGVEFDRESGKNRQEIDYGGHTS